MEGFSEKWSVSEELVPPSSAIGFAIRRGLSIDTCYNWQKRCAIRNGISAILISDG